MRVALEGSPRMWMWVAIASLTVAVFLLAALLAVLVFPSRKVRVADTRLIGTWQSDADRTIVGIRQRKPIDDKQEAALRTLFGKLKVTYSSTTYSTELDGVAETFGYDVLGTDKLSVAFREIKTKPSPLDGMIELSEFTIIYFDGPDSYWLYTQIGGIREYFKRVK